MTKFEAGKEYTLRNGWKAEVYKTDGGGKYPIIGAYYHEMDKAWYAGAWSESGERWRGEASGYDLLPPPKPKHVRWVSIYRQGAHIWAGTPRISREEAHDTDRGIAERIACIRIEFEEGEGL